MLRHLLSAKLLLIAFLAALATGLPAPAADQFTPAELEAAQARCQAVLGELESRLEVAQEQRSIAIRRNVRDDAKRLAGEINSLKARIRQASKKSLDDYAAAMRQEESDREAEREKKAREDAEIKVLPSMKELAECGPLAIHDCQMVKDSITAMVKKHGALKVSQWGLIGHKGHPMLIVTVMPTGDVPVESYEVCFEVKDSFGNVVANRRTGEVAFTKQNTLSKPIPMGKRDTAMNWGDEDYRDAFTASVWVSRVRLADGTLWQQTREQAAAKKHAIRESYRVDVWTERQCQDDGAEGDIQKPD